MSKKREPLAIVINYFTVTEIGEVNAALNIIKEIVRSRQPQPVRGERSSHKRKAGMPRRKPADVELPFDARAVGSAAQ
jgi:hypothetical protein